MLLSGYAARASRLKYVFVKIYEVNTADLAPLLRNPISNACNSRRPLMAMLIFAGGLAIGGALGIAVFAFGAVRSAIS